MCCISMLALERPSRAYKRTPACIAPRNLNERAFPRRPGNGVRAVGYVIFNMSKRLSATDISALASMKNVAKCDTWCELQNPVNHRVFERKLRPKPLGRGHVCLGVTQRCPPNPNPQLLRRTAGGGCWPPVRHGSRLAQIRVLGDERRGNRWLSNPRCHAARASRSSLLDDPNASFTRRSQRDPRSGGATR